MALDTTAIKEVREKTGAGILDCKKAIKEANGDKEKAIKILREKGLVKASKRVGKQTGEGRIISYIHHNGKIGVLLKISCETDFVARNEKFEQLGKDIAMQIGALNPIAIRREDVAADIIDKEKEIFTAQLENESKPKNIKEKIVENKINKYYAEVVLLEQAFLKNTDITIEGLLSEAIAGFGENITIGEFTRYQIGG